MLRSERDQADASHEEENSQNQTVSHRDPAAAIAAIASRPENGRAACASMTKTNSDVLTPAVMQVFRDGDADKLHRLLMLKPWEINPLDAVGKCPYPPSTGGARSWPAAVALRAELERLSKASAT